MLTSLMLLLALVQLPQKHTIPGAVNVTRVDAVLMCGGATTPEAFPLLRKEGFASVINLRRETEPGVDVPAAAKAAADLGLKYIHVPVDPGSPSPDSIDTFLQAVLDPSNQPMYIHCGSANRVAALWLIKRVVVDGWDVPRATEEAEAIGLTSPALRKFALDYVSSRKR